MFKRLLSSFLLIMVCTSCKEISTNGDNKEAALDTIVNFTKVDASPYFKVCEALLDEAKINCFRINIQKYFTSNLRKLNLSSEVVLNEEIIVTLSVHKNGASSLKELNIPEIVKSSCPDITVLIEDMVIKMPKLYPALKRGIPVDTEYKLPIRIKTSEN